jgi:NAD+ diphosphatase
VSSLDPSHYPRYSRMAPIALSHHAHNRIAGRRTDDAWLRDAWGRSSTRAVVLHDARLVVPDGADAPEIRWIRTDEAPTGQRVLLGEHRDEVRFAVLVEDLPAGARAEHLRAFVQTLDEEEAALVLHAVALAEWLRSHRHCPRCGAELEVQGAGHLLSCPRCGRQQFPRTDPAVIMAVTDDDGRCLLGRQRHWPEGRYSTLAGFVEPGESLEHAVAREVEEEVGVEVDEVTYFGNQPWPFPASLMVGFFAHARTTRISVDGAEISDARWFTREQVKTEADAGTLLLPSGVSISRSLVETWYGGPLPGTW